MKFHHIPSHSIVSIVSIFFSQSQSKNLNLYSQSTFHISSYIIVFSKKGRRNRRPFILVRCYHRTWSKPMQNLGREWRSFGPWKMVTRPSKMVIYNSPKWSNLWVFCCKNLWCKHQRCGFKSKSHVILRTNMHGYNQTRGMCIEKLGLQSIRNVQSSVRDVDRTVNLGLSRSVGYPRMVIFMGNTILQ